MNTLEVTENKIKLEDFVPLTLEEVLELADNQRRIDRKYLLTQEQYEDFLRFLKGKTKILEINGVRNFSYKSLYYDTPDLRLYRQGKQDHSHKHKIRSRVYKDTGLLKLEVKTKRLEETIKERQDAADLLIDAEGFEFIEDTLSEKNIPVDHLPELEPVLATYYKRSTFVDESEALRLTIDSDVIFKDEATGKEFAVNDYYIAETKAALRPSDYDKYLWSKNIRPHAMSKYALGVSILKNDPGNKWAPVKRLLTQESLS
jgi:hypothetical protein